MRQLILKIMPNGSRTRRWALRFLEKAGLSFAKPTTDYHSWFEQFESLICASDYDNTKHNPLISVVVPCYNTPKYQFEEMVYSVVNQYYQNWELIIADASDLKKISYIKDAISIDNRIKVISIKNVGIAQNTNKAIAEVKGEYVSLLDHDDTLTRYALSEVAACIKANPGVGLVYSDEDKVEEGRRVYSDPFFKPSFSQALLENVNYITHFSTVKKTLVEEVGGLDPSTNGAQDYDLFLKIADLEAAIVHIPKVLYHWRTTKNSTARDISAKNYVLESGERALNSHFKRTDRTAQAVAINGMPGFYRSTFSQIAKVDVIFFIRDNIVRQGKFISEWLKTTNTKSVRKLYIEESVAEWMTTQGLQIPNHTTFANESDLIEKHKSLKGESLIYSKYYRSENPEANWIGEMAGLLQQSQDVFSASPLIMDTANRIKDAGYHFNSEGCLERQFVGKRLNDKTYQGYMGWVRNVDSPSVGLFIARSEDLVKSGLSQLIKPDKHAKIVRKNNKNSVLWSHQKVCFIGAPLNKCYDSRSGMDYIETAVSYQGLYSLPDINSQEMPE